MGRWYGIAVAIVVGLLVVGWFFWARFDIPAEPFAVAEGPVPNEPATIARPSWDEGSDTVPVPSVKGDAALAIEGELTVLFEDAAAMRHFLEAAEAAGIVVLRVQDQLLAVRVLAEPAALAGLTGEGVELGYNYPVQLPLLPAPSEYEAMALKGFSSGALAYLGAGEAQAMKWGQGVRVAILDTGWTGHPDLAGTRIREIDLIGGPRVGEVAGHGTAVAGLVASANPFAPGMAPGSDLLAVRVLDSGGSGDTFTLADGIVRAVDAGADVINLSLGSYGDSEVLRAAVAYAESKGVVLVASSGNDGMGMLTYPAAYPTVLSVGAIDANGNLTPFSNFGEALDLVAPGYQVNALWEDDSYVIFDGTSASAPLVSGMVARLLEQVPGRQPAELRRLLTTYANEIGPPGVDPYYGAGVLSAGRLENIGKSGVVDIALADIHPALGEGNGQTFPLYVTVQNRGTVPIPNAVVELRVGGTPYTHQFAGLEVGQIGTIQLPIGEAMMQAGPLQVEATVQLGTRKADAEPANDSAAVQLRIPPGGD